MKSLDLPFTSKNKQQIDRYSKAFLEQKPVTIDGNTYRVLEYSVTNEYLKNENVYHFTFEEYIPWYASPVPL